MEKTKKLSTEDIDRICDSYEKSLHEDPISLEDMQKLSKSYKKIREEYEKEISIKPEIEELLK